MFGGAPGAARHRRCAPGWDATASSRLRADSRRWTAPAALMLGEEGPATPGACAPVALMLGENVPDARRFASPDPSVRARHGHVYRGHDAVATGPKFRTWTRRVQFPVSVALCSMGSGRKMAEVQLRRQVTLVSDRFPVKVLAIVCGLSIVTIYYFRIHFFTCNTISCCGAVM